MRKRKLTWSFVAAVLLLSGGLPVSAESASDRPDAAWENLSLPEGSAVAVRLFNCIMPLPPNYLLNTDTEIPGKLELKTLNSPLGIILIDEYKEPDKEYFDIVYEKPIGTLTVIQIKSKETIWGKRATVTIIHDNERKLAIVGRDEHWAQPMAKYCSEHMLPD